MKARKPEPPRRLSQAELKDLAPGELLVRIVRDGWTVQPDHFAIVRATRRLQDWTPEG